MSENKEAKKKAFTPNPKELDGVPDLSSLIYLEEPHVVHNCKVRYQKDLIYTGISSVLVAINPYKQLGCYSNERISHYANKAKYEKGLPHVYNVAEQAYRQLLWTGLNQSMVVCGESGAGKTENAKYLMRHLAYTTSMGLYHSSKSGKLDEDTKQDNGEDAGAATSAKIEQQILAANPILESFGNAKTLLNNNSSRFGKFTKLLFNKPEKEGDGGNIVGSAMETYLLEKSRVVFQAKGERNYHVFYQLCQGLDEKSLGDLGIESAEDFHYLNQSDCVEIPGMNDEYRFNELIEAMKILGFEDEARSHLFQGVAAVMHIGNVEFEDDDTKASDAVMITEDTMYNVQWAARLLGISEGDMERRLTKQSIKIRGKVIWKEYNLSTAASNRDSTAKALYSSMFDWVVLKINRELFLSKLEEKRNALKAAELAEKKAAEEAERLKREEEEKLAKLKESEEALKNPKKKKKKIGSKFAMFEQKEEDDIPPPIRRRKKKKKKKQEDEKEDAEGDAPMTMDDLDNDPAITWIGILDVFGFECFEYNSFEQFCINFTNETLQRYFNYNIMLSEQAEYQKEGIFWKPIELPDNQPTLDLIARKQDGIFHLIDAAAQMPKADDKTFTTLLFQEHGYHPKLREMQTNPRAKHKGRQKEYINGFQISHYAMPVTYNAKEFLIKNADRIHEDSVQLFCESKNSFVSVLLKKLKGKKSKKRTLGYVFTEQLRNLMKNLKKTKPYFVRCIKPNLEKKAGLYDEEYVANQLRCGGLIEAIKIIKCGYPTRVQYQAIFARYGPSVFAGDKHKLETVNKRDFCEAILRSFNKDRSHFEMGLTKVFFKGQQEEFLEELMRKGGKDWKVPPGLVEKIKKHLLRKRITRMCSFMKAFARWSVRLRRLRALAAFAKWARVMSVVNKTMFKKLEVARKVIAKRNMIAIIKTATAVQRLKKVRKACLFMQRHFRAKTVRKQLVAELDRRIKKKRDAQEALAANKAAGVGKDEVVQIVAKEAAKWLGKVVFVKVSENLFDGLSNGVALCQLVKKVDEKSEIKCFPNAVEGSELAKRNIQAAIAGLKQFGVADAAMFDVDDLALLKNPRKVVNCLAAACAMIELRGIIPGIPAFPAIKFEIEEARIDGKEDNEINILLFGEGGEGGVLDNIDEDRKKELVQPGYLDKKRELERRAMEREREQKRRMTAMLEREKKAKEEAAEREKKMKEEVEKVKKQQEQLEKERAEFLEWKKAKAEEEKQKATKAVEEAKKKKEDAEKEIKALDPNIEQKRQFFSLTLAAVLRRFEEHGLLTHAGLDYDQFNSIEMLDQSEKEDVPWHNWNDWVTQRVRARIDAKLSNMPQPAQSADVVAKKQQQQPLPPLPLPADPTPAGAQPGAQPGVVFSINRGEAKDNDQVSVKYMKGNKVHEQYKVRPKARRRSRAQKKSIIVSISGPKPPPPKLPPPKNAKRYHRRRNQASPPVQKAPPRASAIQTPPVAHITKDASGVEDDKKDCVVQ